MRLRLILAAVLAAVPLLAAAQTPPTTRLRGTIEAYSGQVMLVKARDGSEVAVTFPPDFKVGTVKAAKLADIKPGDFVGTAAVKGADGKLHALEVHIFPEAMRGTAEGQHPWDEGSNSSMTNATVGQVTAARGGGTELELKYKDGQATVEVAPNIPVVTLAPGDPSMLVPGRAVVLFVVKDPSGLTISPRVTVESGGVKPPM